MTERSDDLDAINELVARKLGWQKNVTLPMDVTGTGRNSFCHWYRNGEVSSCAVPADYTREIAAAWEIVTRSVERGAGVAVDKDDPKEEALVEEGYRGWHCWIYLKGRYADGIADTAPLAICRAFLKLEDK